MNENHMVRAGQHPNGPGKNTPTTTSGEVQIPNVRKSYLPHLLVTLWSIMAFCGGFLTGVVYVKKNEPKNVAVALVPAPALQKPAADNQAEDRPLRLDESEEMTISVDYDLPLAEFKGDYSRFSRGITDDTFSKHREMKGKKNVVVRIFDIPRGELIASSKEVMNTIEKRGYRVATFLELVAYNRNGPKFQDGWMIALGSVTKDGYVPKTEIFERDGFKEMSLQRFSELWTVSNRFLAVKE